MIRLVSFLWLCFQSICPLIPSLSTYRLIEFLLPWTWGISSWLLLTLYARCHLSAAPAPHSLVAQMVRRLPTTQEIRVQSLSREDPLEKEMATHSSTLAWKIPWMEEPRGLQSMGLQRVRHNWATSLIGDKHIQNKGPGATPLYVWQMAGRKDMAIFVIWGRKRLSSIGSIDVRLSHQLPGKPAAGAGGKHVGSYWLSPMIQKIGQWREWSGDWSSRGWTENKKTAILNGLTMHSTPLYPACPLPCWFTPLLRYPWSEVCRVHCNPDTTNAVQTPAAEEYQE